MMHKTRIRPMCITLTWQSLLLHGRPVLFCGSLPGPLLLCIRSHVVREHHPGQGRTLLEPACDRGDFISLSHMRFILQHDPRPQRKLLQVDNCLTPLCSTTQPRSPSRQRLQNRKYRLKTQQLVCSSKFPVCILPQAAAHSRV